MIILGDLVGSLLLLPKKKLSTIGKAGSNRSFETILQLVHKSSARWLHGFDYLGVPETERENILFIGPSNYGVTDPIHSAALSLLHTTMAFLSSKEYLELTKDIDLLTRFASEVGETALDVTNEFEK